LSLRAPSFLQFQQSFPRRTFALKAGFTTDLLPIPNTFFPYAANQ
jgi:hypothetical protein